MSVRTRICCTSSITDGNDAKLGEVVKSSVNISNYLLSQQHAYVEVSAGELSRFEVRANAHATKKANLWERVCDTRVCGQELKLPLPQQGVKPATKRINTDTLYIEIESETNTVATATLQQQPNSSSSRNSNNKPK